MTRAQGGIDGFLARIRAISDRLAVVERRLGIVNNTGGGTGQSSSFYKATEVATVIGAAPIYVGSPTKPLHTYPVHWLKIVTDSDITIDGGRVQLDRSAFYLIEARASLIVGAGTLGDSSYGNPLIYLDKTDCNFRCISVPGYGNLDDRFFGQEGASVISMIGVGSNLSFRSLCIFDPPISGRVVPTGVSITATITLLEG